MAARRIVMLSGPRNISTTLMRAFESRPDTMVVDEPFYACFLKASGAEHPLRENILSSQSTSWAAVQLQLYTRTNGTEKISFEKHIAFHFTHAPNLSLLADAQIFHLIRDPYRMIASYKHKYADVAPIVESYRVQRQIFEQHPSPVIDATDILRSPKSALYALCERLDIPFYDSMLTWPSGPRTTDGVWAPHWYDAVWNSTGFRQYVEKPLNLTPDLMELAQHCIPDFTFLHERRLKL